MATRHIFTLHSLITFGDGTTEYVFIILSGYSSLILEISNVPIPDPVPPPNECVSWNPYDKTNNITILKEQNILSHIFVE